MSYIEMLADEGSKTREVRNIISDLAAAYFEEVLGKNGYEYKDLYEQLIEKYDKGSPEVRSGIDTACKILVGKDLDGIASEILDSYIEYLNGGRNV